VLQAGDSKGVTWERGHAALGTRASPAQALLPLVLALCAGVGLMTGTGSGLGKYGSQDEYGTSGPGDLDGSGSCPLPGGVGLGGEGREDGLQWVCVKGRH